MAGKNRLMVYAASVAPGGVEHFSTTITSSLNTLGRAAGWKLTILGKPVNDIGMPIAWPIPVFHPLEQTAGGGSEQVYSNARVDEFAQTTKNHLPFEVLYLPSPWRNIPLGSTAPIPAPVVLSIHDLEFERSDYGIITDQHRREALKFAGLGSAFVFSSDTIRKEAIERYGFPVERTHVIYQAPSQTTGIDASLLRRKYNLPEKFAFTLRWLSPRKNGRLILEALAYLKDRGLPSFPLVGAGFGFDDVLPGNIAHQRYQDSCQALIQEAGLENDVIDLGMVEQQDIPTLLSLAAVVIAPSKSEAGLSYLILDAMSRSTPLLYSRIPAFTERLGDDNSYGLSFDPHDAEELAAQIADAARNLETARSRAEQAQQFISGRTQIDVAQDYLKIFAAVSASPWHTRPQQRRKLMLGREERMAWLINHTTLRDAELPIIRSFGMEVYTSKELPAGNEFRTASVDYSEDEHSTLPSWVLERLNQHNFYEQGVPADIAEILNGYFGTVVVTSYFPPLRDLVRNYRGRILVRVFGREHPHNYSEYFTYMGQGDFWRHAWAAQERFWFTPCYESIIPVEEKFLRDRAVLLPLALPDRILRASHRWVGNDRRVMFLCPRIKTAPTYYGRFYEEFKEHLGHLPHIIPGHQPLPVDDPHVTGFVTDDQMQAWFRELRVMFYHSREPRHLHYHPLEAVAYGMPLIFMKGGLVEELMGSGTKPGGCDSYEEAEQKLRRILDGDEAFTQAVIESQESLLDTFKPEFVRDAWENIFIDDIMNTPRVPDVLPFAQWQKPLPVRYGKAEPISLTPNRNVGVYTLTVPGGGIYKYVTGLLEATARTGNKSGWSFELTWGLPTTYDSTRQPPEWEYGVTPGLTVQTLKDDGRVQQAIIRPPASDIAREPILAQALPKRYALKGTGRVVRWRTSHTYQRYRPIRVLSEAFILPAQYARDMIYQRSLRPKNTDFRVVLSGTRLGRRVLRTRLGWWIGPPLPTPLAPPPLNAVTSDHDYLANPPAPPARQPLLEKAIPPERPYLTVQQIEEMTAKYDVVYFPNPFRLISPNTELDSVRELPVAITMFDLAHEFTEAWGANTDSVSREMQIWARLASKIVFCSDYIRDEAIKRYGIPEAKTHVVYQPPMVLRRTRPDDDEINRVKAHLGLPDRYILNTGFQGTHKNNITIVQALHILRWRGYATPPFVIGGVDARRLLLGEPIGDYLATLQRVIRESGLKIGEDLIVADYISEAELPAVYAGSALNISVSRSEAGLHGMVTESMLYQTPLIVSSIPQNTAELGTDDTYALIVSPDDPVAVADAIQYTLDNAGETASRVQRAYTFIKDRTWESNAAEYLKIFEQIARGRAAST